MPHARGGAWTSSSTLQANRLSNKALTHRLTHRPHIHLNSTACVCKLHPAQLSWGHIMQDTGTAKKLAFAREVNSRCITLEGDDFNPSGLLTGGPAATCLTVL